MTKLELADMLERFIGDRPAIGDWEFDDFTSTSCPADLQLYRKRLREMDPPLEASDVAEVRTMISELRGAAQ